MGLQHQAAGDMPVLSAVVNGGVVTLTIDHPLDVDIQPEPEDFILVWETREGQKTKVTATTAELAAEGDKSLLNFSPVTLGEGYLVIDYRPKSCFMYSLKNDDSIGRFRARLPLQLVSMDAIPASGTHPQVSEVPEGIEPDANTANEADFKLMPTAGARIAEANEYHVDIVFSGALQQPQAFYRQDYALIVNGQGAGIERVYLHTSKHRKAPSLRIDTSELIPRGAEVFVCYKSTSHPIALADGALVAGFSIKTEDLPVQQPLFSSTPEALVDESATDDVTPGLNASGLVARLKTTKPVYTAASIAVVCILLLGLWLSGGDSVEDSVAKVTDAPSTPVRQEPAVNQQPVTPRADQQAAAEIPLGEVKNCKLTYPKGDQYVGQCNLDNRPHGEGQYTWTSGSVYTGQWRDGQRQGFGTIKYSNGARYQGMWAANKKHGQGTYWSAAGSRYEGVFANGQFTANGVCFLPDGQRVAGPCPVTELN